MGNPQTDRGHQASDAIAKEPEGSEWGLPLEGSCLEWLLITNSGRGAELGKSWGEKSSDLASEDGLWAPLCDGRSHVTLEVPCHPLYLSLLICETERWRGRVEIDMNVSRAFSLPGSESLEVRGWDLEEK